MAALPVALTGGIYHADGNRHWRYTVVLTDFAAINDGRQMFIVPVCGV